MDARQKWVNTSKTFSLSLASGFFDLQKQPPEVFYKKSTVLKNFAIFTGKHLCCSLFFKKVAKYLI